MLKYNVYGISDWPESLGEKFLIYENKEFKDKEEAILSAQKAYKEGLEIIVEVVE